MWHRQRDKIMEIQYMCTHSTCHIAYALVILRKSSALLTLITSIKDTPPFYRLTSPRIVSFCPPLSHPPLIFPAVNIFSYIYIYIFKETSISFLIQHLYTKHTCWYFRIISCSQLITYTQNKIGGTFELYLIFNGTPIHEKKLVVHLK